MLPDKVYARYYVQDCDDCSDGEVNLAEDYPDWANCGGCGNKTMCEECVQDKRCIVCDEKWLNEEGEFDSSLEPAMCSQCTAHCTLCDVSFHLKCQAEHRQKCNKKSRVRRALKSASETIKTKEWEIERADKGVAKLKKELKAAKKAKKEAQRELQALEAEGDK